MLRLTKAGLQLLGGFPCACREGKGRSLAIIMVQKRTLLCSPKPWIKTQACQVADPFVHLTNRAVQKRPMPQPHWGSMHWGFMSGSTYSLHSSSFLA